MATTDMWQQVEVGKGGQVWGADRVGFRSQSHYSLAGGLGQTLHLCQCPHLNESENSICIW